MSDNRDNEKARQAFDEIWRALGRNREERFAETVARYQEFPEGLREFIAAGARIDPGRRLLRLDELTQQERKALCDAAKRLMELVGSARHLLVQAVWEGEE